MSKKKRFQGTSNELSRKYISKRKAHNLSNHLDRKKRRRESRNRTIFFKIEGSEKYKSTGRNDDKSSSPHYYNFRTIPLRFHGRKIEMKLNPNNKGISPHVTPGPGPAAYDCRNCYRSGVKNQINSSTFGVATRLCAKSHFLPDSQSIPRYLRRLSSKPYTIGYE